MWKANYVAAWTICHTDDRAKQKQQSPGQKAFRKRIRPSLTVVFKKFWTAEYSEEHAGKPKSTQR